MTWVNLNDIYVPKTGGTVTGDLGVDGSIVVNDGTGSGTTYDVASEITDLKDAWDSISHISQCGVNWPTISTDQWDWGGYVGHATITFPKAMPSTNYGVCVTIDSGNVYPYTINKKTVNGFDICINPPFSGDLTIGVNWCIWGY